MVSYLGYSFTNNLLHRSTPASRETDRQRFEHPVDLNVLAGGEIVVNVLVESLESPHGMFLAIFVRRIFALNKLAVHRAVQLNNFDSKASCKLTTVLQTSTQVRYYSKVTNSAADNHTAGA